MLSRLRPVLASSVVLALTLLAGAPSAGPASAHSADGTLKVLGRNYGESPVIAATPSGATLIAFTTTSNGSSQLVVKRATGKGGWSTAAVPKGTLGDFSNVQVAYDPAARRLLLVALASGPAVGEEQSLFVWVSTDGGRSFGAPRQLGPQFGNDGKLALDGAGGFWIITNTTNVKVTHVSRDLVAEPELVLSERIASRGGLELATVGRTHGLLTEFEDGSSRLWVHRGLTENASADTLAISGVYGPVGGSIAADAKAAMVAAVRSDDKLWVRRVALSGPFGTLRAISGKDEVVSFSIDPVDGRQTGRFRATWVTYEGLVRTRVSSTSDPSRPWGPTLVIAEPGSKSDFRSPVSTSVWTAMGAVDGKGYLVAATRTRAVG